MLLRRIAITNKFRAHPARSYRNRGCNVLRSRTMTQPRWSQAISWMRPPSTHNTLPRIGMVKNRWSSTLASRDEPQTNASPQNQVGEDDELEAVGDEIPLLEYNSEEWERVEKELEDKLKKELAATFVSVRDAGGCGTHLEIVVESPQFASLSKLEQHRLVYQHIKDVVDDLEAHAISIYTRVPKKL